MADIFRRKSLDKLSSPEQLDRMIVINSPMTWVSLVGGAVLILSALLWGVFGRVPITEEGSGILLREGEVNSVYAGTQGVITKVNVRSGDKVKEGDILYEVNSQEIAQLVLDIQDRIAKVRAVTYDSANDVVTSDNQALIDLKNQKNGLPLDGMSYEAQLEELNENYKKKKEEVDSLKNSLDAAQDAYYNVLSSENGAEIQYKFEAAASEYSAAESAFNTAENQYQAALDALSGYQLALEDAKAVYELAKKGGDAKEIATSEANVDAARRAYEAAEEKVNSCKKAREEARKERSNKESVYEKRKAEYEAYVHGSGKTSADNALSSSTYSQALSDYNTALAELKSLENEIATVKVQLSVSDNGVNVQENSLEKQFASAKEAILDALNRELDNYDTLVSGMEIKATISGVVYSTFVTNGSSVTVDTEVARISENDKVEKLQAVYFMALGDGKKVEKGMKVNIYPSTLSKEEYGHLRGTVVKVADYVTSYADLYTRVGDSTLAETFSANGAVLEIVCEIEPDENTVSGYAWSSKKGADVDLQEGTLLGGSIVTKNVPPITMLIPKLKETFHLE